MSCKLYPVFNHVEAPEHEGGVGVDDHEPADDHGEVAEDGGGGDDVEAVLHRQVGYQAVSVGHLAPDHLRHGVLHGHRLVVNLWMRSFSFWGSFALHSHILTTIIFIVTDTF